MYKKPCENCGKQHNFLTPWGRYCSPACKQAAYRKRQGKNAQPLATDQATTKEKRPAR